MLLIKTGGPAMAEEWRGYFAEFRPSMRTASFDAPEATPEEAEYALCWEPPPGWLASLPRLRAIFSIGAGVDHITLDPTWPRHLPLVRMGGEETGQRMGEYVAWACLSLLRNARHFALNQAVARWEYEPGEFTARDRTVGIMGLGTLGVACVPMLRGLGFPVRGWTRSPKRVEGVETFAGPAGLDEFLAGTQILVCLLPATPETNGIVDARLLAQLPRGAAVVNAARGAHVVLSDLIAVLDSGHLAGAVLDAFEPEPLAADSPVWSHPKVTITPHVASIARRRERARFVTDAIADFEAGKPLPNLYDPVRGY
ncbi:2-hydroxyacid dehydrogenase [Roseomonas sp. CCTCC AB2023176]|uniref:2-hydroxyacid dehydrogenase n=1 Tax=Roseomonas sp. CCTCC AB2023176 TaxID=3342640 RepID=UPI0035E2B6E7